MSSETKRYFQTFDFATHTSSNDFTEQDWGRESELSLRLDSSSRDPVIASSQSDIGLSGQFHFASNSRLDFESNQLVQDGFNPRFASSKDTNSLHFLNQPEIALTRRLNTFVNDPDSPFAILSRNSVAHGRRVPSNISHQRIQPNIYAYRSPPQSEVDSFATAQDSAYYSKETGTQSVKSAEPSEYRTEYPVDQLQLFDNFQPFSAMPGSSPGATSEKAEEKRTSRSPPVRQRGKRDCERCNITLNCPSDYRYVVEQQAANHIE